MPGLFGAIPIREPGRCGGKSAGELLAAMLSAATGQDFYEDVSYDGGPSGGVLSTRGLPGLGGNFSPFRGASGLVYGRLHYDNPRADAWPAATRGFFSAACTGDSGDFWVVADKRGSEPVYYARCGDVLCFAPEVAALAGLPGVGGKTDPAALASLLVSGHLYGEQSLFAGIRRLRGGNAIRIHRGVMEIVEYWRFTPGTRTGDLAADELAERLAKKITTAVREDLEGARPAETAILLSGGYDSRAIIAAASTIAPLSEVHTVSWGVDEIHEDSDAFIASGIARTAGTRHIFLRRDDADYARQFEEACSFTEWQSDMPAFHPAECEMMRELRALGIRRVLRGDQTFGVKRCIASHFAAPSFVGLRPFYLQEGVASILQPPAYEAMCDASRESWREIGERIRGMSPNQAKDFLYFTEHLQKYLNSATLYKKAFLDHRMPLIADDILDFLSLVPDDLREHKKLLKLVIERSFPSYAAHPMASSRGLEDWGRQLYSKSPLRTYVERQLDDTSSTVWEIFRRDALKEFLARGPSGGLQNSPHDTAQKIVRQMKRAYLWSIFPAAKDHFRAASVFATPPDPLKIFMRFLVIKNWHDRRG